MRTALEVQMIDELYHQAKWMGMELNSGQIHILIKDGLIRVSIDYGQVITVMDLDCSVDFNWSIHNKRQEFERDLIVRAFVSGDAPAKLMTKADIIMRRNEAALKHSKAYDQATPAIAGS